MRAPIPCLSLLCLLLLPAFSLAASAPLYAQAGVGLTMTGADDATRLLVRLDHNGMVTVDLGGPSGRAKVMITERKALDDLRAYLEKGQAWMKRNTAVKADGDKPLGDVTGVNGALRLVFMADPSGASSVFLVVRDDNAGEIRSILLTGDEPGALAGALADRDKTLAGLKGKADMSAFE